MLPILFCIRDEHDLSLVALAAFVCVASALGAVLLLRHAHGSGKRTQKKWVATAGFATGMGIWATHFIAMLGYDPGFVIGYHLGLTLASLGLIVFTTIAGFTTTFHWRGRVGSVVAAVITGGGISAMHYLGMQATEMPALFRWNLWYVIASVLFAIAPLVLALPLAVRGKTKANGLAAAILLTVAVVLLHFTGMTALSVIPSRMDVDPGLILAPNLMSIIISLVAICTLGLSLVAAVISRGASAAIRAKEQQFGMLMDGMSDYAICMLCPKGEVTNWNVGAQRLFGYHREEALGLTLEDFGLIDGNNEKLAVHRTLRQVTKEGSHSGEGWCQRKNGSRFWAHFTLQKVKDDQGRHVGFAKITRDMTHQKEHQDRLEQMRRQLDTAMDNMHQGLCLYGSDGNLILANKRYFEMWQVEESDIPPGTHFHAVREKVIRSRASKAGINVEDAISNMHKLMQDALEKSEGTPIINEFGDDFVVSVVTHRLPDGGWVTTVEDITEQRRSEARIAHLAMHDGLTGLPNRIHFAERLDTEMEVAKRSKGRLGLAVIDLDRFKEINDTRGHAVGDEALKMLASRLEAVTGDGEVIARLGGDEFAAVKNFANQGEFDDFIRRLSSCFDDASNVSEHDFVLAASIGVAIYPQDGDNREHLLNNADLAMYRAKASMGENICYYEKGMDEIARDRRQLSNDLRKAIEREELSLLYQPQHSLQSGELTGYEALLRWHHSSRGMVSPDEFIPIAEETGEIFPIGEWVLKEACREAALWPDPLKIAVNISAVQLMQPTLPEIVAQTLLETGLPARRLELEITETAIIGDKTRALHILRAIKAMGVSIAMDDFGTGYSSLDTLHSFPFDKIKIDKSFVLQSDDRPQARAIIRAVLALGHSLNVPVLAEGVENEKHMELLKAEGCSEVQGYLIGRPAIAPSTQSDQTRMIGGSDTVSAVA